MLPAAIFTAGKACAKMAAEMVASMRPLTGCEKSLMLYIFVVKVNPILEIPVVEADEEQNEGSF